MTADEFLKKYNKCPFCKYYSAQRMCDDCKWKFANGQYSNPDRDSDKFYPTQEWHDRFNREVTE